MSQGSDKEALVRFDLPRGLDAAAIAKAIRENCRRILDEAAEQRQAAEQKFEVRRFRGSRSNHEIDP